MLLFACQALCPRSHLPSLAHLQCLFIPHNAEPIILTRVDVTGPVALTHPNSFCLLIFLLVTSNLSMYTLKYGLFLLEKANLILVLAVDT